MWVRPRRRCRRSPGSMISFLIVCAVLFIVLEGFLFVERRLRPALTAVAVIKADGAATDAINEAIRQNISNGVMYHDLIKTAKDDQGRVVMAQLNYIEINRIMAATTIATREALANFEAKPISIPLGEVFDSYLLAAYGPKIVVKMIPMGRVNTELDSSFEAAGINQTRHKIYLQVHTEVLIIIPFTSTPVHVVTTVPLTDTIYIGEVPDTVVNLQFQGFSPP